MDWKKRLKTDEDELKALVDRLAALQPGSPSTDRQREIAFRSIGQKIVEMRAYADDCLGGGTEDERFILEYRLRIEFPLFAHLSSLSSLSREYVEWSCA